MRLFIGGLAVVALGLGGGSAFAGSIDPSQGTPKHDDTKQGDTKPDDTKNCADQQEESAIPANVIVIRTLAGHDSTQLEDGAALIPMHVDLTKGADGKVDNGKVVQQTKDQLDKCKAVDVHANQGKDAPKAVQQEFARAQQGRTEEVLLNWSYWYPYSYGGYYGYSYYPYYGYYSSYYPSYGYYYGGYTYPYYYAGYYPYGGYNYYYYYNYYY